MRLAEPIPAKPLFHVPQNVETRLNSHERISQRSLLQPLEEPQQGTKVAEVL
jgi:hypothetical protein